MKIRTLSVFMFLFFYLLNFLEAQTANDNPNNNTKAEISFSKMVHDYGIIKKGADGSCEFKFKNTGKEPLLLTNVSTSCGCTVPTWPKEPIKPRKTDVIKVVYDTKRLGTINKTITVWSNAKTQSVVLTIKGMVTE